MFTGIVTDIGEVLELTPREAGLRLRIGCAYDPASITLGASIACGGACLTAVETGREDTGRGFFDVDVSSETLVRTTLGSWRVGTPLNLERSLALGDELGGHLVAGHVDGVAAVLERRDEGGMAAFRFRAPADLARFVAEKGSVALDGTSLTVNRVEGRDFEVMIIPHTLAVTTWGERRVGDDVNMEADLVARYVARLMGSG